MTGRQPLAASLAIVAAVAAVAGAAAWHVRGAVIDRRAFVDRAGQALDRAPVREAINAQITEQVLARVPGGLISADRIGAVVDQMTATHAFRRVFRRAAGQLNDALFVDEGKRSGTLRLDVAGVLSDVAPQLAATIPSVSAQLISVRVDGLPIDTRRSAAIVRTLAAVLPVLAIVALAGALLLARDRRRTIVVAALATTVCGALLLIGLAVSPSALRDTASARSGLTPGQVRDAVGAIWDVYANGLRTIAIAAIAAGVVVAAAVLLAWRPRRQPQRPMRPER